MNQENIFEEASASNDTCEEEIIDITPEASATEDIEESEEDMSEEDKISKLQSTISELEATIKELQDKSETQNKVLRELSEFNELFGDIEINSIPECVWDSVKDGTSLSAAYALYEKRCEAERARIELINSQNSSRSAGRAGRDTGAEYFSPDEVRKMSSSEVHANYSKIKESMKKWI